MTVPTSAACLAFGIRACGCRETRGRPVAIIVILVPRRLDLLMVLVMGHHESSAPYSAGLCSARRVRETITRPNPASCPTSQGFLLRFCNGDIIKLSRKIAEACCVISMLGYVPCLLVMLRMRRSGYRGYPGEQGTGKHSVGSSKVIGRKSKIVGQ